MTTENILLIDIGNTSICVATGRGPAISALRRLDTAACTRTSATAIVRQAIKNARGPVQGSVLCSVVPRLNELWVNVLTREAGRQPIVVHHRLHLGVTLDYPKPATLGTDRLANVCGAVASHGTPVIVVDFGTATTFDVVTAGGRFVGGVIAPGLRLMTDYMADRTALLPKITVTGSYPRMGRSTQQAMQIGAGIGYRGLVREIIGHLVDKNNLGRITLVATGGLAGTVMKGLDMPFITDKVLTLQGMARIYELN